MTDLGGSIEYFLVDTWFEVIRVDSLFGRHSDLNACLFGIDNYAQFEPLFDLRGLPQDLSLDLSSQPERFGEGLQTFSWLLWSELKEVDWNERARGRDRRTTEFMIDDDDREREVTKWLNFPGLDHVRDQLDRDPEAELRIGSRVFRRLLLQRKDALAGTEFPLLMRLMECLAQRFGDDAVRWVVRLAH